MKKKKYPKSTPLWRFLFVLYVLIMLWLLFGRSSGWGSSLSYQQQLRNNMSLVPFHTIGNYWRVVCRWEWNYLFRHGLINLVGNVIMFIPLGFCLPMIWEKQRKLWKVVLTTTLIITLVEIIQLLTLVGSCDTDDLILNVIGSAIGYGLYRMIRK